MFDKIRRYDQALVWLNFVFLLFIVFVPFPTAVVVSAQSSWLPVAFYASNIACAGFALTSNRNIRRMHKHLLFGKIWILPLRAINDWAALLCLERYLCDIGGSADI